MKKLLKKMKLWIYKHFHIYYYIYIFPFFPITSVFLIILKFTILISRLWELIKKTNCYRVCENHCFWNCLIYLKKLLIPELVLLDPLLLNNNKNLGNSHIAPTITKTNSSKKKVRTAQHWFLPMLGGSCLLWRTSNFGF